jgi:hypothetical protein
LPSSSTKDRAPVLASLSNGDDLLDAEKRAELERWMRGSAQSNMSDIRKFLQAADIVMYFTSYWQYAHLIDNQNMNTSHLID